MDDSSKAEAKQVFENEFSKIEAFMTSSSIEVDHLRFYLEAEHDMVCYDRDQHDELMENLENN